MAKNKKRKRFIEPFSTIVFNYLILAFLRSALFLQPFLFTGSEKKMQNKQTEPAGDTRRCTKVHREVKFAYSKEVYIKKKKVH